MSTQKIGYGCVMTFPYEGEDYMVILRDGGNHALYNITYPQPSKFKEHDPQLLVEAQRYMKQMRDTLRDAV